MDSVDPPTPAGPETPTPHKRRKRYSGTHPKRFDEKYKELDADKFPEEAAKAKERGSTPAGTHIPIMVNEVMAVLEPLERATILDCTLGWGGHASEFARRAGRKGRVIGLDRDGDELARTEARLKKEKVAITARQSNYAGAAKVLRELEIDAVDALFADLGVSSMQLDRPDRGMSYKLNGPLDMRMDRSRGKTAAEWIASSTESQIADALSKFGEEPDAKKIAAVLAELVVKGKAPKTTGDLASAVSVAKGLGPGRVVKKDAFSFHPAARSFQALRIAVNAELEALGQLLRDLPYLVRSGGRVAILTFHSLEEGLVRISLSSQAEAGLWLQAPAEPVKASPEEIFDNPRARSARLWNVVRA